MKMVTIRTCDLIGPALDWAVAQVDGVKTLMMSARKGEPKKPFALFGSLALSVGGEDQSSYAPSTCWHCGGPLIDTHDVQFFSDTPAEQLIAGNRIAAFVCDMACMQCGPTRLIAACRAIVAAKLGEVVRVPAELVQGCES